MLWILFFQIHMLPFWTPVLKILERTSYVWSALFSQIKFEQSHVCLQSFSTLPSLSPKGSTGFRCLSFLSSSFWGNILGSLSTQKVLENQICAGPAFSFSKVWQGLDMFSLALFLFF